MLKIVRDKKKKSLYRAINQDGEAAYAISLYVKEGYGSISRGQRERYALEFNWRTKDKYDAMKHMDSLALPYRITDPLGKERGWMESTPHRAITGNVSFHMDGYKYQVNFFRDFEDGPIEDLSIYLCSDTEEYGKMAAKVSGLTTAEVAVESYNDLAAEVAVLVSIYLIYLVKKEKEV